MPMAQVEVAAAIRFSAHCSPDHRFPSIGRVLCGCQLPTGNCRPVALSDRAWSHRPANSVAFVRFRSRG